MNAAVELGAFGGRLSVHDPEGCRLEMGGVLEDLAALIVRLGLLPAPPPASIACPEESRALAELADRTRQEVARMASNLAAAAFPSELAEIRAERAAETAEPPGSPLVFPRR